MLEIKEFQFTYLKTTIQVLDKNTSLFARGVGSFYATSLRAEVGLMFPAQNTVVGRTAHGGWGAQGGRTPPKFNLEETQGLSSHLRPLSET